MLRRCNAFTSGKQASLILKRLKSKSPRFRWTEISAEDTDLDYGKASEQTVTPQICHSIAYDSPSIKMETEFNFFHKESA